MTKDDVIEKMITAFNSVEKDGYLYARMKAAYEIALEHFKERILSDGAIGSFECAWEKHFNKTEFNFDRAVYDAIKAAVEKAGE